VYAIKKWQESVNYWAGLANSGIARAKVELGILYYIGVPTFSSEQNRLYKNFHLAKQWFRAAAEQGDPKGAEWLGLCYLDGKGIRQNEKEAMMCFRTAAQQKFDIQTVTHPGLRMKTPQEVESLNEEALAQHHYQLGVLFQVKHRQLKIALRHYRLAVGFGHPSAEDKVTELEAILSKLERASIAEVRGSLESGWCIPRDLQACRKAAGQGNPQAQYRLGDCYLNGIAVARDVSEAVHWYAKAAIGNNIKAQKKLYYCYGNGYGFIPQQQWVKDEDRADCVICQTLFTPFTRKHHCRRCGEIICGDCYLGIGYHRHKICTRCYPKAWLRSLER
jgi:TPR repeat protein